MTTLTMANVTAGYHAHDIVLDDVSLTVEPGRVSVVLGPNGSGKSTTLRVLTGFVTPRSGAVLLDGDDITGLDPAERLSRGIALLPQGRSVFPQLSVQDNLRLGAWQIRHDGDRLNTAVEAMFERYPSLVPLRARMAGSLSGGQARLVEFARTLITEPAVLLIDEPSVGLSPALVDEVYDEIARLKEEGRTILLVDQNVQAAVGLADEVFTLAYGRNHLSGSRDEFAGQLDQLIKTWLSL
ncbi:ABC transporter ATP-binding protein [Microbacterium sp. RD1]|uniref:ABC transporter ATP-binding protein n=1 Tax=Microbacterium sp. RD1 TaxID=3457313 RepID=UPI003FA60521